MSDEPRVTLLAGGVGGAKMAEGLAASSYGSALTVIGNIADDHEFHGLHVSPDLDALLYSLSDQVDREQGWGLAGDSYRTLDRLATLGVDTWMKLGDLDFATHIRRTELLRLDYRLTDIVAMLADSYGVRVPIRPPTDDAVRTCLKTDEGWLDFQQYFVRERCLPEVREIAFVGAREATPTAEALAALAETDLIIIAPSNPLLSIAPMLAMPAFERALQTRMAPVICVSPLIGGRAVKGPADRVLKSRGYRADCMGLADFYQHRIDGLVLDPVDSGHADALRARGLEVMVDDILMRSAADKRRLAESIVSRALSCRGRQCP